MQDNVRPHIARFLLWTAVWQDRIGLESSETLRYVTLHCAALRYVTLRRVVLLCANVAALVIIWNGILCHFNNVYEAYMPHAINCVRFVLTPPSLAPSDYLNNIE